MSAECPEIFVTTYGPHTEGTYPGFAIDLMQFVHEMHMLKKCYRGDGITTELDFTESYLCELADDMKAFATQAEADENRDRSSMPQFDRRPGWHDIQSSDRGDCIG